jgi:hypothetical protein
LVTLSWSAFLFLGRLVFIKDKMAEGKKSFIAYTDWYETFKALPDDKAGQLIKHVFSYVNDENPKSDDILINAVFANIKQQLKRDLIEWKNTSQVRSEIGKIGGIKSGESRRSKQMKQLVPKRSKTKQNEQDTVNVNDTVNDNVNVTEEEKNIIPPPIFLISKYCKERNNGIDPEYFYDWYQTRGWKVGKDKMKDWQSAVRTWEKRNKKEPEKKLVMP